MRFVDGVDGRLWVTIRLRDELGAERLMLGEVLRVCVLVEMLGADLRVLLRLVCIPDRDGVLMRGLVCRLGVAERCDIELRLLRVGMDRCGVGRAVDRELDRLGAGADRVVCLLLCCLDCTRLRLLLRELRLESWPSAASASTMTQAIIPATWAVLPLNTFFFTRNIM